MIEAREIIDRVAWLDWRKQDVTASDAAALFGDGVHPYRSAYHLWAIKCELVKDDNRETPEMRRGRDLEPIVLAMARERFPEWDIKPGRFYLRDPATRIGATPDAIGVHRETSEVAVFQFKTANEWAIKKNWRDGDSGEIEVPLWIAVQTSVEAWATHATRAYVVVLDIAAWDIHDVDVPLKSGLLPKLTTLVDDFWRRVKERDPYPPDYNRDAAILLGLYADDDGGTIDLSGNPRIKTLVVEQLRLKEIEAIGRAAKAEREPIDAEIIHLLGNAQTGLIAGGTITAKTTRRPEHITKATSFRAVRIKL